MYSILLAATAEQHRQDLIREADRERLVATALRGHGWRVRLGERLVGLGTELAGEPAEPPRRPRTRAYAA